ncbi:hypothetical protein ACRRQY_001769 [Campylobacter jejuni]|uniref:hypothetical protein n=1 Tax=Campylobacter jejuni TaxID=197 RepID=UPI001374E049|nr:hypothetical protein [Campylobacter jejuni]
MKINKIIWTCINCQKINDTSLGSLKSLEKTEQILTSFNEEVWSFIKNVLKELF